MYYPEEITKVYEVGEDQQKRLMGPITTKPLVIKMSLGGRAQQTDQRISQDAALELYRALEQSLKARGCL